MQHCVALKISNRFDGLDRSPGGVKYRTPYSDKNIELVIFEPTSARVLLSNKGKASKKYVYFTTRLTARGALFPLFSLDYYLSFLIVMQLEKIHAIFATAPLSICFLFAILLLHSACLSLIYVVKNSGKIWFSSLTFVSHQYILIILGQIYPSKKLQIANRGGQPLRSA